MPYITAEEYRMVHHLIAPSVPQNDPELRNMEGQIYALNRQIRALPGERPTPEWQSLMERHKRLISAYRAAGGKLL